MRVACCSAATVRLVLVENHVRGRRQHFGNGGVGPFNGVDAPSIVDAKIATDRPSPLLKALQQSRGAGLTLRVTFGVWKSIR